MSPARTPPPLARALDDVFRAPRRTAPSAPVEHYQVYTDTPGSPYRINPAYIGEDRAVADRIAVEVGGMVHVCAGRP